MIFPKLFYEALFYLTLPVSIGLSATLLVLIWTGTQFADGWLYLAVGSAIFTCISFLEMK